MPAPTEITVPQLARLVGLPGAPALIDVRSDGEYRADSHLVPAARRHCSQNVSHWCKQYAGRASVVVCQNGGTRSQATAAALRHEGIGAQTLVGGYEAWRAEHQPLVRGNRVPHRDCDGRTIWVTRARPKVVRVACPWLIRRFIDPNAVFLFVPPAEVAGVAEHAKAATFDVEGAFWSDRGERTTFDVMLDQFDLKTEPLAHLALIVRGADTGRLDLTPQSAGLLAACLGYSRMYRDDLEQLNATMAHFDAVYRWARDATAEQHG
jgi:rhodanese-related sulfurtransferase